MGRHFPNMAQAALPGICPCGVAASVRLATRRGFVAAGDLVVGEAILTRDSGYRPLRRIEPLGPLPCIAAAGSTLLLRPDHGLLLRLASAGEVLVAARDLAAADAPALLRHLALALHLDQHEILLAEGGWIESQPGAGPAARPRLDGTAQHATMRKIRVAGGGRGA